MRVGGPRPGAALVRRMRTEGPNAAGRERQRQTLWRTVHRFFRPAPQSVCDKLVAFRSLGELDTQPGVDGLPSHFPIGLGPFQNICLMHDRGCPLLRPRHRTARCRRCRACAITESSAPRVTLSRRMMAWTRGSASTSRSEGSRGCPSRATDTQNIFACSIVNLPSLASSLSRIIYARRSRADNRADVEEIVRRSVGHNGVSHAGRRLRKRRHLAWVTRIRSGPSASEPLRCLDPKQTGRDLTMLRTREPSSLSARPRLPLG